MISSINNGVHKLFGYPCSSKYLLCSAKEINSYRVRNNMRVIITEFLFLVDNEL